MGSWLNENKNWQYSGILGLKGIIVKNDILTWFVFVGKEYIFLWTSKSSILQSREAFLFLDA
jgi:hypothetical protein